jgi:hypothetical protein
MVQHSSSRSPLGDKDKRISNAQCRELLGLQSPESNLQVEAIRDCMYALANIVIAEYVKKRGGSERVEMESAICDSAYSAPEMTY